MKREAGDFIEDIVDAINKSLKFVEGMSFEEFTRMTKQFLLLSEPSRLLEKPQKTPPTI
nr:hypothetical protein [Candidatus Freyarchaeota archaeon]